MILSLFPDIEYQREKVAESIHMLVKESDNDRKEVEDLA